MEELLKMGREAGLKKLAEHEQLGTIKDYIKKVAPDYIDAEGDVMKFSLIEDLGWWK